MEHPVDFRKLQTQFMIELMESFQKITQQLQQLIDLQTTVSSRKVVIDQSPKTQPVEEKLVVEQPIVQSKGSRK